MNIVVNGTPIEVSDNLTVRQLLEDRKVKMLDMVSVEVNETILERGEFAIRRLAEGDKVEFLYFIGGGHGAD